LKHEHKKTLVFVVCVVAGLALLIATIGAALALLTGHARWIELAWLSIAALCLFWFSESCGQSSPKYPN
jgi:Na+-transporting NADH:ubiquinone oxidoreductase subunit NqrB